jgi:hypothetical protein
VKNHKANDDGQLYYGAKRGKNQDVENSKIIQMK